MKGFQIIDHIEDLDKESKYLVHKAKDAAQWAHAPYSKLMVGAAILFEDGEFVSGCSQENETYSSSLCAERVALYAAASQYPGKKIKKLAVVAHKKNHKDLIESIPCGACRQVILEFEERQKNPITCIFYSSDNKWILSHSTLHLLPSKFSIS